MKVSRLVTGKTSSQKEVPTSCRSLQELIRDKLNKLQRKGVVALVTQADVAKCSLSVGATPSPWVFVGVLLVLIGFPWFCFLGFLRVFLVIFYSLGAPGPFLRDFWGLFFTFLWLLKQILAGRCFHANFFDILKPTPCIPC